MTERISHEEFVEMFGIEFGASIEDEKHFEDLNAVLNELVKNIYNRVENVRGNFMQLRSSQRHRYIYEGAYFGLSVNISGVTVSYDIRLKSEDSIIDKRHVSYYDPLEVGYDGDRKLLNKLETDLLYLLDTGAGLTKTANEIQRDILLTPQQYIQH